MERYPLTITGMDSLLAGLYALGDKKLQAEAESLAADPLAWIAEHVELEVRQLEYLRNINDSSILMFGWSLATAIVGRRPVILSHVKQAEYRNRSEKSCILYKISLSAHFSEQILFSSGNVQITFTEPA